MSNYVSNQEIREQAGFQSKERNESLADGDGSTVIFYVANKPIVDSNYSGSVSISDVVVRVGTPFAISTPSAIDAASGKITLISAPADGTPVAIDYDWSILEETLITIYADEAHSLVLASVSEVYALPLSETPGLVKLIEKKLAAGLLLDKEYSAGGDGTEDTRGRRWIKWAEAKLEKIATGVLELKDSNGVVLTQKSGVGLDGFPNNKTKDLPESDSGGAIHFRISKKF